MIESSTRGTSSTFSVARQVANWVRDIDPSVNFNEDDILPLCVGPMRKVLYFSMMNFRSRKEIIGAENYMRRMMKISMDEEKRKNREYRSKIHIKIRGYLEQQKLIKISLNDVIQRLQVAESRIDNLHDDFDALGVREGIIMELSASRRKELYLWSQTIDDLNDTSQIQSMEATILAMRKECANVLQISSSGILDKEKLLAEDRIGSELSLPKGSGPLRQTDAELNSLLISEFIAATRASHIVSKMVEQKIVVPDENEEIFKNSLELDLAAAEKTSLKQIIIEVGIRPVKLCDALLQLRNKNESDWLWNFDPVTL